MDEQISAERISDESTTDPRAQRGLALAQAKKDSVKLLVGAKYLVPSAASNGSSYVVVGLVASPEHCGRVLVRHVARRAELFHDGVPFGLDAR